MKIRTRFAPSPTGNLHIGGIRTALYAYAYAKKHGGDFILRIEDTDRKRYVKGSIETIINVLKLYNIHPDLMPDKAQLTRAEEEAEKDLSNYSWILDYDNITQINDKNYENIFIQSQRLPLYQKYAIKMLNDGYAYACFATEEELAELKKTTEEAGEKFIYRGQLGKYSFDDAINAAENGKHFVIRLDVDSYIQKTGRSEVNHNETNFPLSEVNDQVILKSDGFPTYHLGVVVDDYLMSITHAMRAWEWIPSTPKQIMIYEALGWEMKELVHLTAILNSNGKGKLSKRDGSVNAMDFIDQGYLPEAVLNFLMLLGWSSPEKREFGEKEREFYSLEDFVDLFDLKDLNNSNPIFNRDKLIWFNQKYISTLSVEDLVILFTKWSQSNLEDDDLKKQIIEKGVEYINEAFQLIHEKIKLLKDIPELLYPFYFSPEKEKCNEFLTETKQTKKIGTDEIKQIVLEFLTELEKYKSIKSWGHEKWEATVRGIAEKKELGAGNVFMSLRIIVLGTPFSPPLFESMELLEKEEVAKRLKNFN